MGHQVLNTVGPAKADYEPPRVLRLGTISELTMGSNKPGSDKGTGKGRAS